MAERYANWHRKRLDDGTTSAQQAQGRKVLGELMEQLQLGGLPTGVLRKIAPDGTVYIASFDGTTPTVQIETSPGALAKLPPPPVDVWIPQGFVFTPGNDVSPTGFGLPVQFTQTAPDDAFDPTNTNPGLGVQRWKAGGPCAQVLLTRQDTTDYPREKPPAPRRIPIGFDGKEWVAGAYTAPPFAAWHVVRPRFNDFSWTADVMGARRSLWNTLNAAQGKPVSLPFAGYYDDAQLIVDLGTGYGTDTTKWPLAAYRTETERANADGVPTSYAEAWTNGLPADLTAALGTFHDGVPTLDAGLRGGIKSATLRTRDAWIDTGNIFWHPTDPALPTLSWLGYPAQNLPNWLVTGAWVGATGGAIFPLEGWHYEWRGQTRYVYGKNLYAMGRCIGVLPATLISAAIRVETLEHTDHTKYQVNRVVAITWDAADQFGNTSGIAYLWAFKVWCVDFPRDGTLPLHVTTMPMGAYDKTSNPTGWQLCGSFAAWPQGDPGNGVGGLPDRCLWQMPRFNGDGTAAIAAFGVPPYAADWGPLWAQEQVFSDIAPDALTVAAVSAVSAPPGGAIVVADYDATGGYVWVWSNSHVTGDFPTPEGPSDAVFEMFEWSKGGVGEVTEWAGVGFAVPDKWVLDACDGAMVLTDHWFACPAAQSTHQVRMTRRGARVATDTIIDTANIVVAEYESTSYLDRLNASYVRDRNGNWMMGYDFGVTAGASTVYVSTPVCGQAMPATTGASTSAHFGSRWISSAGDPADMAKIDGLMRAFPLGVV